MQPVTVERAKGWLGKRFEEETLVPMAYFRGKNDNETRFHLDEKRSITVPLSMHQVFNAMEDALTKNEPLDLTRKGIAAIQEKYADQEHSALREGHIKASLAKNKKPHQP